MIDKTIGFLEDRLAQIGAMLAFDHRAMHELRAVAAAIRSILECDLLVIIGASAITDRRDVVPTGIVVAGGVVEHLGIAMDPGSMLLSDRMPAGACRDFVPVIGAPGCIRSAKFGSFDIVLPRLIAG